MVDPAASRRWLYYALFLGLALSLMLLQLLPLGIGSQSFPGPDVLLCVVLIWTQRRPDFVPLPLLAPVLLFADFVLMRPPGLWAALTLLGAEFLRKRHLGAREVPFMIEWGFASCVIFGVVLCHWAINALVSAPPLLLSMSLVQALMTALAYPLVMVLSQSAFQVRKLALDGQGMGGKT